MSLEGDRKSKKAKAEKPKKAPTKKAAKGKRKRVAKKKVAKAAAKADAYGCGACGETFPSMKAATKHALIHTIT